MKCNKIGIIAIALCLITLGIVTPVSAGLCYPLTISGWNLNQLSNEPSWAYSNGLLYWTNYGQNLMASYSRASGSYTQFADNNGQLWGECVSAVKALSGNSVTTPNWVQGSQVTSGGVSQGTVIATFVNGQYPQTGDNRHAAIFKAYTYDGNGVINGFQVWDQGWVQSGLFGMHTFSTSGSGKADADSYSVVLVP